MRLLFSSEAATQYKSASYIRVYSYYKSNNMRVLSRNKSFALIVSLLRRYNTKK